MMNMYPHSQLASISKAIRDKYGLQPATQIHFQSRAASKPPKTAKSTDPTPPINQIPSMDPQIQQKPVSDTTETDPINEKNILLNKVKMSEGTIHITDDIDLLPNIVLFLIRINGEVIGVSSDVEDAKRIVDLLAHSERKRLESERSNINVFRRDLGDGSVHICTQSTGVLYNGAVKEKEVIDYIQVSSISSKRNVVRNLFNKTL